MERFLETLLGNISETVEVIRFYIYATFLQCILTKQNVSETLLKRCLVCRGCIKSKTQEEGKGRKTGKERGMKRKRKGKREGEKRVKEN